MKKNRVVVGLSGGVDSAVSAKLLLDQRYEVIGVFLKNWEEDENCPAAVDALDARNVAKKLDIPFYTFNFSKEYWDQVFAYFLSENKKGRTPNPDILCNKFIKFGSFLEKAKELKADFIATGHYAKKFLNPETKKYELHVPIDKEKDQTYFLYALSQDQLAKALFPLTELTKSEVRKLAKKYGFENAGKKDSTGICFIGERNYSEFLQKYLDKKPGKIVTPEGEVVGDHIGLSFYTIGQRRELRIGGVRGAEEAPWFVIGKDKKKNELIVNQDEKLLFCGCLQADDLSWISGEAPGSEIFCEARIRYRQTSQSCLVRLDRKNKANVYFSTPQRAVTPGQSVVFYQGENCLGGGIIS